jgi:non-homologous end joining protein Ku
MAPRTYWKGYLRLSLVSCPVQLFPPISKRERIKFHQINRKTGNRIKYCKLDAVTGEPVGQGCSTLSTESPLEKFVDAGESCGVAILAER